MTSAVPPEVPSTDRPRQLGFLLRDVSRLYGKNFERHAHDLQLTLPQCKALAHLSLNQGISQARLAEIAEIDPMALVRTLDRMEQDRWIERRPDPADRRAHRLYMLASAEPVVRRMWEIADQCRGEALSDLSAPERDVLFNLLERVHVTLSAHERK